MESILETIREEAGYRAPLSASEKHAENMQAFWKRVRSFSLYAFGVIAITGALYIAILVLMIVLQDYTGEYAGYNY